MGERGAGLYQAYRRLHPEDSPTDVAVAVMSDHLRISSIRIAERHSAAGWVTFARTSSPDHAGLPAWPPYQPDTRATMILDSVCRVEHDPLRVERQAWAGIS